MASTGALDSVANICASWIQLRSDLYRCNGPPNLNKQFVKCAAPGVGLFRNSGERLGLMDARELFPQGKAPRYGPSCGR